MTTNGWRKFSALGPQSIEQMNRTQNAKIVLPLNESLGILNGSDHFPKLPPNTTSETTWQAAKIKMP